jgi:hypothetical protein
MVELFDSKKSILMIFCIFIIKSSFAQMFIDNIKVNGRLIANEKQILLPAGINSVLFEFIPISNAAYYYRVKSLNDEWVETKLYIRNIF